jgi:hypothetical protein
MYFSMSRKQKIMTITVMRNDIDFLMKELKKSNNINNHHNNNHNYNNNHHNSSHNRINNRSNKKDSMIWTLQAVTVHLEERQIFTKWGGR